MPRKLPSGPAFEALVAAMTGSHDELVQDVAFPAAEAHFGEAFAEAMERSAAGDELAAVETWAMREEVLARALREAGKQSKEMVLDAIPAELEAARREAARRETAKAAKAAKATKAGGTKKAAKTTTRKVTKR
jgi:hypothetical protein